MIACVAIPYFLTSVEQRDDPHLQDRPMMVGHPVQPLMGYDRLAKQAGVNLNLLPHQAQTLCPQIIHQSPRPLTYQGIKDRIDIALARMVSHVMRDEQDNPLAVLWYMNLKHIPQQQLAMMANTIANTIYQDQQLYPLIGIARSRFSARVAATQANSNQPCIVMSDDTVSFLAPQPIAHLKLTKKITQHLHYLGMRTLGHIGHIPRIHWQEQFGSLGKTMVAQATGRDHFHIPEFLPEEKLMYEHDFEPAVTSQQPLWYWLQIYSQQAEIQLMKQHQVCQQIALSIQTEQARYEQQTYLRQATRQHGYLYNTFIDLLKSMPIKSPVTTITLVYSHLTQPTPIQLRLFEDHLKRQYQLQQTLQTLQLRYGSAHVHRVRINPTRPVLEQRISFEAVS